MNRNIVVRGKIISSELATVSSRRSLYGNVIVREENGEYRKVKVDIQTDCDSVFVGDMVQIHAEKLGDTDIYVAHRISLVTGPFFSSKKKSAATTA